MKKIMTILMLLIGGVSFGQVAFGDVVGTVVKAKTGEAIFNARISIIDNELVYRAITDPDGYFKISAVPAGMYQLTITFEGDTLKTKQIKVISDGVADAGTIPFTSNFKEYEAIVFKADNGGIKLEKGFLPLPRLTAKEIEKSPVKFDINSMVSSMTTDVKMDDDGSLVFRGARKVI